MSAHKSEQGSLSPHDERRWAAIAWIASGPFGPIIPAVIFAVYRNRSEFVARHALQAACSYAFLLAAALLMGIVMGVGAGVAIASQGALPDPGQPVPPIVLYTSVGAGLVICLMYVVLVVAAFVFAARARRGEDVRYPVVHRLATTMLDKPVTR